MKNQIKFICVLLPVLLLTAIPVAIAGENHQRWLLRDVVVIDGTGTKRFAGDVRVADGLIAEVGDLQPADGETVFEGNGQMLAPGFIDTHSHADRGIAEHRDALAAVSQGVTTVVVGQDGSSPFPLTEFFETLHAAPPAINFASFTGHNTLRSEIMGDDFRRVATPAEIESMEGLLKRELNAGALGLSSGLEYEPGIHSLPDEVTSLARATAAEGARYISHLRSEDRWLSQAVDEIIEIGRVTGMPVQISHMKLAMKNLWGTAPELIRKLDAARAEGIDITADIYPYTYWQANMMVLIPSRDLDARHEYEFALKELSPPEGFWLTRFDPQPEYVGKKLTEIAGLRGIDPVTAMMQLTKESTAFGENADSMIGTSMTEEDIRALFLWPHTNVCTDGMLNDLHPRGVGSFTRVLGRFVREEDLISLEQAVHKMTGLSAQHMGINGRGLIRPGMAADMVLFDPNTVIDNATPEDPQALSNGITTVWVNGVAVYDKGKATGDYPGQVLRRQ